MARVDLIVDENLLFSDVFTLPNSRVTGGRAIVVADDDDNEEDDDDVGSDGDDGDDADAVV